MATLKNTVEAITSRIHAQAEEIRKAQVATIRDRMNEISVALVQLDEKIKPLATAYVIKNIVVEPSPHADVNQLVYAIERGFASRTDTLLSIAWPRPELGQEAFAHIESKQDRPLVKLLKERKALTDEYQKLNGSSSFRAPSYEEIYAFALDLNVFGGIDVSKAHELLAKAQAHFGFPVTTPTLSLPAPDAK